MAAQPPDPEIDKLLAELRSDWAFRRQAAAEKIAELRLRSDEIVSALKVVAGADENRFARKAAANALNSLSMPLGDSAPPSPPGSPAKPIKPLSRREKIVQFTIGFAGWFLANWGAWLTLTGGHGPSLAYGSSEFGNVLLGPLLLFPINVIVLIVLAFTRRWVALGVLTANAVNLLAALVMSNIFAVLCYVPFFVPYR